MLLSKGIAATLLLQALECIFYLRTERSVFTAVAAWGSTHQRKIALMEQSSITHTCGV